MKAIITFTQKWIKETGEEERIVENLTEVHYCYESPLEPSTAFESDIDGTGFTMQNKYIKEFEILETENKRL